MLVISLWNPFLNALRKVLTDSPKMFSHTCTVVLEIALVLFLIFGFLNNAAERGFTICTQDRQWRAAQQWAKEFTPKDALFLTPYDQQGFRVYSGRSAYFTWEDIAPIMWCPHHSGEIMKKQEMIMKLGLYEKPYNKFSRQKVLMLCREKGIDFLVLPTELSMGMKPCYSNEKWSIYDISSSP